MPSDRIDRPEHSFQSVNLVTEVATDAAPGDPHRATLAQGEIHPREERMSTFYVPCGSLIDTDSKRDQVGCEDAFTSQLQAFDHFEVAGLDQAILDAMIR